MFCECDNLLKKTTINGVLQLTCVACGNIYPSHDIHTLLYSEDNRPINK